MVPGPASSALAHLQQSNVGELAELLIDCEPGVSHSYPGLQALFADYKEKDGGEAKVAELLVKLAKSSSANGDKRGKAPVVASSLYLQLAKPSISHTSTG